MWRILVPGSPGQPHPGQTDARSSGEKQHFDDDDINKNTIREGGSAAAKTAYTVLYMPTHIAIWLEGFKILGALLI